MAESRTIVCLTDGELELARSINELRRRGHRVLATSRPYEAVRWTIKSRAAVFIARYALLPEDAGRYIDEIREVAAFTRIAVISDAASPHRDWPVDLRLDQHATADLAGELGRFITSEAPAPASGGLPAAMQSSIRRPPSWNRAPAEPENPAPMSRICDVVTACRMLSESEDDVDVLVHRALEFFTALTGSRRASVMMRTRDNAKLRLVGRIGFPPDVSGTIEVSVGDGIAGRVLASEKPMLVKDVESARIATARSGYSGQSFLVVPVLHRRSAVGVINLTNRHITGPYTEEELIYAMMLADQFGANYQNAVTLAELRTMTVIDPLTGLYNRRHFDNELKRETERARRYGRELTLALMDLDDFKQLNDQCGYSVADDVLREVANIIKANFREVDIVTRWGGDEFAVILPETGDHGPGGRTDPRSCIDRVRQCIERTDIRKLVPEALPRVTISIGVATFPSDGATDAELFERATSALQDAKRRGNNRTRFFA